MNRQFCLGCPVTEVFEGLRKNNDKYSSGRLREGTEVVERLWKLVQILLVKETCPGMPDFQVQGNTTNIVCMHNNAPDMDATAAEVSGDEQITITAVNVRHERKL